MTLSEELFDYIAACFTGIWLESHEHSEAALEIENLCRQHEWQVQSWDVCNGLAGGGSSDSFGESADPLATIKSFGSNCERDTPTLLLLKNFHRFLGNAEIVQTLAERIQAGKHSRTFFVVLAPMTDIPMELEKLFVVLEHKLPTKEQLENIARDVAEESELPTELELAGVLSAASGMTRYEAENAYSLSIIREGRIKADTIQMLKSQALKKSGLLSLHESEAGFDQLGGMDSVKEFCKQVLNSPSKSANAKGVLLLGVPGTGKSAFAKALGKETGRPTLVMDIGRLMGGLVGQTEGNVRRALEIVDAIEPAVLFIDELEKGLAGSGNGGRTDSGVSMRMLGSLLTWLSDHTSDVFVVATSNDISQLPPELTRAERFDGIFFCDLPSQRERIAIWQVWMSHFGIDPVDSIPSDENWTGSEIRSCCRLASLLNVPLKKAAEQVVPIAVTNRESVDGLRNWADRRCLSASESGVFRLADSVSQRGVFSPVGPSPSNN